VHLHVCAPPTVPCTFLSLIFTKTQILPEHWGKCVWVAFWNCFFLLWFNQAHIYIFLILKDHLPYGTIFDDLLCLSTKDLFWFFSPSFLDPLLLFRIRGVFSAWGQEWPQMEVVS
jgi:hypothetical protein